MRPRRIRCSCCFRLMAYEPYRRGDALRRPAPQASVCWDCKPITNWATVRQYRRLLAEDGFQEDLCVLRGCVPASVVDKLASLTHTGRGS